MSSWRSKLVAAVAAASVLAFGSGATSSSAAPTRSAASTAACVGMDGAVVSGGGPSRATVVVDTGTGPVWSACISFSGSITGIDALERAEATITDLDPVYDQYVGLGRAVCRLRTVGSDPPDCLGKTAQYWSFSVNGRVASVGAGAVTVRDGDVHGWAYGTGGTPRAATMGSRATSAPPPTTTTTAVSRPSPTAPRPTPTVPSSGPSSSSPRAPTAPPSGRGETDDGPGSEASAPGASSATTTTVAGSDEVRQVPATEDEPRSSLSASEPDSADERELAAAPSADSEGSTGGGGGPSGAGSLVGFGAALAAMGIAGVLVRRRRATAVPLAPTAPRGGRW